MTLVSVIMPAYNSENTIAATLKSVRVQNHSELEIIVIDDGSKDATANIANSSAKLDGRIRVYSYPNGGLPVARNRGIDRASGEFLTFIDADDLWTRDKVEAQLSLLQEHPQAGLAYSLVDWIDESDQFIRDGSHIQANGDVLERLLIRNFTDNGSNILIRREVIDTVGKFNTRLAHAQDFELCLRVAEKYEFVCVPEVQVLYRISKISMSSNVVRMSESVLQILEACFSRHPGLEKKIGAKVYADKYRYFIFKSLEGLPNRKNGVLALKFLPKAIVLEPAWWLERRKMILVVLAKAFSFLRG